MLSAACREFDSFTTSECLLANVRSNHIHAVVPEARQVSPESRDFPRLSPGSGLCRRQSFFAIRCTLLLSSGHSAKFSPELVCPDSL
jgi:hypothetical protein